MALLAVLAVARAAAPAVAAPCRADVVELRGPWGQARFTVELADEPQERALGLMFRRSLPQGAGMLFVYPRPQSVSFWMRNTLIPLDMIFAGEDGVVRNVHRMARPLDETPIFGGQDIRFVLEINGGLAARLGIAPGSEMRHPAIDPARAAWPCD
ncbi:MAG: DUF192 domain-containing protein [Alphaproteobacteria bacterium]|nr:MAG: DUF192 domain-containing protein [Alphaproteobacteria bacterium]